MKRGSLLVTAGLALLVAACATAPAGPQEVTVTAVDLAFEPATLEVVAGRPVVLTLVNEGALEHDLSVAEIHLEAPAAMAETVEDHEDEHAEAHDEADLHVAAEAGHTNSIEFTPTEPGTYQFICTVAGHKEAGMIGTLVVTAP